MTERLHFHSSLSCTGEGNGNPLQCSYLENPRDRGAWWAAVYGVTQSWTQLKRLSSSSSRLLQSSTPSSSEGSKIIHGFSRARGRVVSAPNLCTALESTAISQSMLNF